MRCVFLYMMSPFAFHFIFSRFKLFAFIQLVYFSFKSSVINFLLTWEEREQKTQQQELHVCHGFISEDKQLLQILQVKFVFSLQAWLKVLESFSSHYHQHRQAVKSLAILDALISLSSVAKAQGYCRPTLSAKGSGGARLKIVQGRHPVVSQLQAGDDQYVANDTNMEVSECVWCSHCHSCTVTPSCSDVTVKLTCHLLPQVDGERVMLVTGPNMGGKSCYMRQVALIALMAQMGSYVPAESLDMTILDAIYTR